MENPANARNTRGIPTGVAAIKEYCGIMEFRNAPTYARANTSIVAYGIANKKSATFYLVEVALHFSYNIAALFDPFQFLILIFFLLTLLLFGYLYQKTPETFIAY